MKHKKITEIREYEIWFAPKAPPNAQWEVYSPTSRVAAVRSEERARAMITFMQAHSVQKTPA